MAARAPGRFARRSTRSTLTALAPDSAWAAGLDDANLASTVLAGARRRRVRILFTGDAEAPGGGLAARARAPMRSRADVLKVGAPRKPTSTTPRFLAAVRPRLALVSVGAHNAYGHPDPAVMDALPARRGRHRAHRPRGTVVVRSDGEPIEVEARGAVECPIARLSRRPASQARRCTPLRWLLGTPIALPARSSRVSRARRRALAARGLALRVGGWCLGRRRSRASPSGAPSGWRPTCHSTPELLLHELRHVHQFEATRSSRSATSGAACDTAIHGNPYEAMRGPSRRGALAGGSPTT